MSGRFELTIDTEQFAGNTGTMLARSLMNAAARVQAGNFEFGETHNITVDGKVVGTYKHVATRQRKRRDTGTEPNLDRAFNFLGLPSEAVDGLPHPDRVVTFGEAPMRNKAAHSAPANKSVRFYQELHRDEKGRVPSLLVAIDLASKIANTQVDPVFGRRANGEQILAFVFDDSQHEIAFDCFNKGDKLLAIVNAESKNGPVPLSHVRNIARAVIGGLLRIEPVSGAGGPGVVFHFDDESKYETHFEEGEDEGLSL